MRGTTHLIGGIAAAAISTHYLNVQPGNPLIFYSCAFIGAAIPDVCHPRSMIGRRLPMLSRMINKLVGHRSLTHSLLFLFIVYWLTGLMTESFGFEVQMGLIIGIVSHLLLDVITPRGIQLFFPLRLYIRTPITIKTGSTLGESLVNVLLVIVMITVFF